MGIGHFQKNCPQKDQITCKTCGEKYENTEEHECSGEVKCIHCSQNHRSNATKCPVIKDYKSALTKSLLTNRGNNNSNNANALSTANFPPLLYSVPPQSMTTTRAPWALPSQPLDELVSMITKQISEEAEKTRESFEKFKKEMVKRDEEKNQKIAILEAKVENLEAKLVQLADNHTTDIGEIAFFILNVIGQLPHKKDGKTANNIQHLMRKYQLNVNTS
ncbi:unnamed protein product [Didymodactylos carnosus]|uniref:Uncharacterized protein n=1 Tax=Didymodactylos carnosus TaxID=1234261 RepID=A0A815VTW4_9BILA|nr:unnamed protein product [Didymodactylos carnosus]CAF4396432.1 unnamed protein product [Didymodactylos carnosus]